MNILTVLLALLSGEDEEEGGVDLDENIEIGLGQEGGDLTDDNQEDGWEKGGHQAACQS